MTVGEKVSRHSRVGESDGLEASPSTFVSFGLISSPFDDEQPLLGRPIQALRSRANILLERRLLVLTVEPLIHSFYPLRPHTYLHHRSCYEPQDKRVRFTSLSSEQSQFVKMAPTNKRDYRGECTPAGDKRDNASQPRPQPSVARGSLQAPSSLELNITDSSKRTKLIGLKKKSTSQQQRTTTMAESPTKKSASAAPQKDRTSEGPDAAMTGIQEPKLPSRKDTSLKEFLGKMDDYAPIVSSTKSSILTLLLSLAS